MVKQHSILLRKSTFKSWMQDRLRFNDTDLLGHINNAFYATACESGRVSFLGAPVAHANFALAHLVIDFKHEIFYPGVIDIGTTTLGIGTTSITMGHGLFSTDQCVATCESVCVLIDLATRRPIPIPQAAREVYETFKIDI